MSRLVHLFLFLSLIVPVGLFAEETPRFGGVGLQVVPTINGTLVILRVVEGTPAAEQGLMPGDLIVAVGDQPLEGSDFGKVVSEHLWGEVGSEVILHTLRPGLAGQRTVTLVRTALDPRLTVTPAVQDPTTESQQ